MQFQGEAQLVASIYMELERPTSADPFDDDHADELVRARRLRRRVDRLR